MQTMLYQFKRTAIHNIYINSSHPYPNNGVVEGLVLPESLMKVGDIAPYERILVTKHGGNNWMNRIYSFAIPGAEGAVEARGSLSRLLQKGEYCCIISGTYLDSDQYQAYCSDTLPIPTIDIRFQPNHGSHSNDLSLAKMILEIADKSSCFAQIDIDAIEKRKQLPRIMLSNLASGLKVTKIERHCIEMSAELPVEIMKKAGMVKNQSIFVFNASRGGMSAESYVVPNTQDNEVIVSGALSRVADLGDIISEASFVITDKIQEPIIYNACEK